MLGLKKKRHILPCLIIAVILLLFSCAKETVALPVVSDDSYMNGWYIDNSIVYIVCRLVIISEEDVTVSITAYSEEDVGGLLENARLTGYNEDMSSTNFDIETGFNELIVVFVGVHGKNDEKYDYGIPDKIVLEREKTVSRGLISPLATGSSLITKARQKADTT